MNPPIGVIEGTEDDRNGVLRELLERVSTATTLADVNVAAGIALEALGLFT